MSPIDIEARLIVEAIFLRYGHDFRDYAPASLKRRLLHAQHQMELPTLSAVQELVLRDAGAFSRLLEYLTVPVSEMFRDPPYYRALRAHAVPVLKTYPSLKVWIAGCGGGEEAFSMAILLHEEGLLERTILYATDINPAALAKARHGVFTNEQVRLFTQNYQKSGGAAAFSDYYTAAYDGVVIDKQLRKHITFADHSLATDSVFAEMHLVSCRNVLIYFNRGLQDRALGLFHDSLVHRGFLGLGTKETLEFSAYIKRFEPVSKSDRLFRKVPE